MSAFSDLSLRPILSFVGSDTSPGSCGDMLALKVRLGVMCFGCDDSKLQEVHHGDENVHRSVLSSECSCWMELLMYSLKFIVSTFL